jgi:hypothetical protein
MLVERCDYSGMQCVSYFGAGVQYCTVAQLVSPINVFKRNRHAVSPCGQEFQLFNFGLERKNGRSQERQPRLELEVRAASAFGL